MVSLAMVTMQAWWLKRSNHFAISTQTGDHEPFPGHRIRCRAGRRLVEAQRRAWVRCAEPAFASRAGSRAAPISGRGCRKEPVLYPSGGRRSRLEPRAIYWCPSTECGTCGVSSWRHSSSSSCSDLRHADDGRQTLRGGSGRVFRRYPRPARWRCSSRPASSWLATVESSARGSWVTPRTVQKLDRGVDGRSCITLLPDSRSVNIPPSRWRHGTRPRGGGAVDSGRIRRLSSPW